jgi:hypothetical protein
VFNENYESAADGERDVVPAFHKEDVLEGVDNDLRILSEIGSGDGIVQFPEFVFIAKQGHKDTVFVLGIHAPYTGLIYGFALDGGNKI